MPEDNFQIEAIGSVYAQALINEANKQNALPDVTEDIQGIGTLLRDNDAFRLFTQSPTLSEDQHDAALDKIFSGRIHPLTLNMMKSLSRRGRLMFLHGAVSGFELLLKQMSGHIDAELVSAHPIDTAVVNRIKEAAHQSTGKTLDMKVRFDPALIGGMKLTIGDTLIDGSVATQLDKIEEQLKRGGRLNAASAVTA